MEDKNKLQTQEVDDKASEKEIELTNNESVFGGINNDAGKSLVQNQEESLEDIKQMDERPEIPPAKKKRKYTRKNKVGKAEKPVATRRKKGAKKTKKNIDLMQAKKDKDHPNEYGTEDNEQPQMDDDNIVSHNKCGTKFAIREMTETEKYDHMWGPPSPKQSTNIIGSPTTVTELKEKQPEAQVLENIKSAFSTKRSSIHDSAKVFIKNRQRNAARFSKLHKLINEGRRSKKLQSECLSTAISDSVSHQIRLGKQHEEIVNVEVPSENHTNVSEHQSIRKRKMSFAADDYDDDEDDEGANKNIKKRKLDTNFKEIADGKKKKTKRSRRAKATKKAKKPTRIQEEQTQIEDELNEHQSNESLETQYCNQNGARVHNDQNQTKANKEDKL